MYLFISAASVERQRVYSCICSFQLQVWKDSEYIHVFVHFSCKCAKTASIFMYLFISAASVERQPVYVDSRGFVYTGVGTKDKH